MITKLREAGLIDDADFARQVARVEDLGGRVASGACTRSCSSAVSRAMSPIKPVDEVLEEENVDEVAVAERVARKRLPSLARPTRRRRRRRLYSIPRSSRSR